MGDRTDLPKIKPDDAPSILNGEAAGWGMLGGIAGGGVGFIAGKGAPKVQMAGIAVGQLVGALFGGTKGKAQQEKEQTEGRIVKEPGYWNRGIITGWFMAAVINAPLIIFGKIRPNNGIALFGTVAAMVTGSIIRKNGLQHDFDQASQIRSGEQAKISELLQNVAAHIPESAPVYKNSVSPAESAALAEKQEQKSQSHVAATQAPELHQEAQHAI